MEIRLSYKSRHIAALRPAIHAQQELFVFYRLFRVVYIFLSPF